ncbi:MAG TPA: histidine kinase, partial [Puia sp.]
MTIAKHTTRWREHEFVLSTLLCIIAITGACWKLFEHSTAWLYEEYGREFRDRNIPFDYTRNILLPAIFLPILLYCCYLWMNLYILPRLLQTHGLSADPSAGPSAGGFRLSFSHSARIEFAGTAAQALKRFLWGLFHTIALLFLLGIGWGIIDFYSHQYRFPPDISNIMIMGNGLRIAINVIILFIAYAIGREAVLRRLEATGDRSASKISALNQITAFLTGYFALGGLLTSFINLEEPLVVFYFGLLPAAILAALTNLYWFFPMKGSRSIFKRAVLWRLLLSTLGWSIPFGIALAPKAEVIIPVILLIWLGQLFITTPISWLIYQQQKDKILRIRGLETELGQSQADLQFLRSQINPHFLFNVLNTLYGTALYERADRTAGGIQQLGDMMRFMLHENNLDQIAMSKEIEYVKNYISLQKLRTQALPSIEINTVID